MLNTTCILNLGFLLGIEDILKKFEVLKFFFISHLAVLNKAFIPNLGLLDSVEVVNYTFPDGGQRRRLTIENNATQPSCAGVGAELGNRECMECVWTKFFAAEKIFVKKKF